MKRMGKVFLELLASAGHMKFQRLIHAPTASLRRTDDLAARTAAGGPRRLRLEKHLSMLCHSWQHSGPAEEHDICLDCYWLLGWIFRL